MAITTCVGDGVGLRTPHYHRLFPSSFSFSFIISSPKSPLLKVALASQTTRSIIERKCFVMKEDKEELTDTNETMLHSFSPLPLLYAAALLPGGEAVTSLFEPFVEIVKSFDLPGWLVHWGHPGNMAVVLFAIWVAMGNPGVRNVHGILGSGIMMLFLVHAALGLQLGLSY
ncbi:unnamed protein product [Lupinus luteus]|uniref:Uncharacterized protein n=1 Tax=Lupinus luteus TaxID=3873 RepID=A0AAV1VRK2_LUPLU